MHPLRINRRKLLYLSMTSVAQACREDFFLVYLLYQIRSDRLYILFLARIILSIFILIEHARQIRRMQFPFCTHACIQEAGEVRTHGPPSDQASLVLSIKATTTYVNRCAIDDLDYSDSYRRSCCNIDMPQLL
jgi:hypothetical protein